MNVEKCKEWVEQRRSPNPKNPLTNRIIKKGGPKYKELDKECAEFIVDINLICQKWLKDNHNHLYTQLNQNSSSVRQRSSITTSQTSNTDICDEWVEQRRSPSPKNPYTNRVIKKNGPKYKDLDKECEDFIKDVSQPSPRLRLTNIKKKIPVAVAVTPRTSSDESNSSLNFYSIDDRIEEGTTIKDYFASIIIANGKACMSQTQTLLKYIGDSKLLGYGSFGNVYRGVIPKTNPYISVAIKEGRISSGEYKKALIKQYPMEYLFNKLINDLIDDKVCPNFTYTYAIFFCDKCTLDLVSSKSVITQCSETIVELFDGTLDKLGKELSNDKVMESILFQVFFALASIQLKYGIFHNDIKQENILIKVIPKGGYWEYNLDSQTYYVPNYGYIAALNDFGVSMSYMPGISLGDYGYRQAEVILDVTTGAYRFKPFTTELYPSILKNSRKPTPIKPYSLIGKEGLTGNHFYKDFDSKPSISVDLKDFNRFPAHYFNFDIMDIVLTFLGGKRTSQPGDHVGLTKSTYFVNLLKDFRRISIRSKWPANEVYLFLASQAIKKIFSFYTNTRLNRPKIETYNL